MTHYQQITLYGGTFTPEELEKLDAIELQKWVVFVNRLFKALSFELAALEREQARDAAENASADKVSQPEAGAELDPLHTKHLLAITQTIARVRVVNDAILNEEEVKRTREAVRESNEYRKILERRLLKIEAKIGD